MQHLEVSGAVRRLKWSLGVKWLTDIRVTMGVFSEPADSTDMTSSHLIFPSAKGSTIFVETKDSLPYSQQPTTERSNSDPSLSKTVSLNLF